MAGSSPATTTMEFSPELAFILTLALRMAITAAFVVSASVITERSGPVIGALIATLPISADPSYVFLALDHDAAFIAAGALASLPINAATIWLALTYVVLAQRHNALISCGAAAAVWLSLAALSQTVHWSLAGGLLANAITFAICLPLLRRFRQVRMPLITRRWYRHPAARIACRYSGRSRRGFVALGRAKRQRRDRAVSGGVYQHDADPAPANRRAANRGGDRQWRLGPDRIWSCHRCTECRRDGFRLGRCAWSGAGSVRDLESWAVVERAQKARAMSSRLSLRGALRRSNPATSYRCRAMDCFAFARKDELYFGSFAFNA